MYLLNTKLNEIRQMKACSIFVNLGDFDNMHVKTVTRCVF